MKKSRVFLCISFFLFILMFNQRISITTTYASTNSQIRSEGENAFLKTNENNGKKNYMITFDFSDDTTGDSNSDILFEKTKDNIEKMLVNNLIIMSGEV